MTRGCALAVAAAALAGAAGCGGDGSPGRAGAAPPPPARSAPQRVPTTPEDPGLPKDLRLPPGVPREATGPGDPRAARVVRAWVGALRRGDIARAAAYFAQPSKAQNGTPVLTLDTRTERLAFNVSFPCGAVVTEVRSAGRYAIVTFRLTERRGGDCRGAAGQHARSAIRVAHGRIAEWYRLRDPGERPPQVDPRVDPGDTPA